MIVNSESSAPPLSRACYYKPEGSPERTAGRLDLYRRFGKRLFDFVASAFGLAVTSPLFGLCAVAIQLDSPGPIFFRQRRVGQGGKPFEIIKFRTMVHQPSGNALKITADGDSRITPVGKWLRKLKMDELPQLFNVLKGEMSLVGPRPEVPEYVAFYNDEQKRVLDVKAGITGPASLAYIDEEEVLAAATDKEAFYIHTLMPRKLSLDLRYCERVSLAQDLRMILATLARLFHATDRSKQSLESPSMTFTMVPPNLALSMDTRLEDGTRLLPARVRRERV